MGFEENRFLGKMGVELKCTLCRLVLDNPVYTPCKKLFCASCILPFVLQEGRCPINACKKKISPMDLRNAVDVRRQILNQKVTCEHVDRGCKEVTVLGEMDRHQMSCQYRPVECSNKGCGKIFNFMDLDVHERDFCDFRPVRICQNGCKLVVMHWERNSHDCIQALRAHITEQEVKISSIEGEFKTVTSMYRSREKMLLAKMSNLHNEIQQQAISFKKKLKDYINRIAYLSKKIQEEEKGYEESHLTVTMERVNGSLGFNIMGGYSPENNLSDGIIVSRVTEGSPAEEKGLRVHDKIIKINGQDLTQSTHEEAVEAFQTAKEPIVVEVLRRVSKGATTSSSSLDNKMKTQLPSMVSTATQTDEYIEDAYFSLFCPPTPPFGMCGLENLNLVQPASRHGVAFASNVDMGLTDLEMANELEYDEDFDPDRTFDMEYEEVTLHRRSTKEKIGLTLCYGNTEDDVTDIFISEVEPYSIAAQDGRIREGDQILQINSTDVHNREQAIQLFSENRSDITLLLARPQVVPMDDGFMDGRNALDDLQSLEVLEQTGRQDLDFTATVFAHGNEEEGGTTDTATTENSNKHEKDSGVGRTDDSTRNDESSEQELLENECVSPASNSKLGNELEGSSAELHYSNDSFTSNDMAQDTELASSEIPAEECAKFREVLETRCADGASSKDGSSPRKHRSNNLFARKDSQSSIEREIAALNYEMEQIHLECQEIVEAHTREQHKVQKPLDGTAKPVGGATADMYRSPRLVPRMGTRLDYLKQLHTVHENSPQDPVWVRHEHLARTNPAVFQNMALDPSSSGVSTMDSNVKKLAKEHNKDKDLSTTSAYNTGDSCRSTPLTLELQQGSDDSGKGHKSSMLCLAAPTSGSGTGKPSHSDSERLVAGAPQQTKEWCSDGDAAKAGVLSKSQSNSSVSRMSQTQEQNEGVVSLQKLYAQYAEVMYTNQANLQHTIMVQQKLFQQQLMQRARQQALNGSPAKSGSSTAPSSATVTPSKCPPQNGSTASPSHSASHQTDQSPSKNDGGASSCNASGTPMEWVVKKRADGSRYITRRPVRSKLLKERARKINDERAGMTTDDDAISELKVGRYWSKEERKRHLEKAKEHRRKKEMIIKQKMETVKESEEAEDVSKKEPNIVELSHRKMMKHKGRKVFDDFTTLQEMLAHGSREPQGKTYNPLLSVTTV